MSPGTIKQPAIPRVPIVYNWDFLAMRFTGETYSPPFNPGAVSFAPTGSPMIRDEQFNLQTLNTKNGQWKLTNLLDAAKASLSAQGINWSPAAPGIYAIGVEQVAYYANPIWDESRIVYDTAGHAYAILASGRSSLNASVFMHSSDGAKTWTAYLIPGSGSSTYTSVSMEQPTAGSTLLNQPPVLLLRPYFDYAGNPRTMQMVTPILNMDGSISFAGPFTVATNTITDIPPAGNENAVVSSGNLVHIVYPGATLALDTISGRHGTPEYAVTVNRTTGAVVTGPTLLGVGVDQADESVVDEHNQPTIAMDRSGFLHTIVAGHDGPLYYLKSTAANNTSSWGTTQILGQRPSNTWPNADEYSYPSLLIDINNNPVIVVRWAGHGYIFRLVVLYMSVGHWVQQTLVDPGRPFYGIWYHKATVSRSGKIFIHYKYFPDNIFADEALVIESTFGLTLTPNPTSCVATNHDSITPSYCAYNGYATLTNAMVCSSDATFSSFGSVTSGAFFS